MDLNTANGFEENNPLLNKIDELIDSARNGLELQKVALKFLHNLTTNLEEKTEMQIRNRTTVVLYFVVKLTGKLMELQGIDPLALLQDKLMSGVEGLDLSYLLHGNLEKGEINGELFIVGSQRYSPVFQPNQK